MSQTSPETIDPNQHLSVDIDRLNEFVTSRRDADASAGQFPDADVVAKAQQRKERYIADGTYLIATQVHVPPSVIAKFVAMAHAMGVSSSHLYVATRPNFTFYSEPLAAASFNDVVISRSLLSLLTPPQLNSVIGHELAHIKNADYSSGLESNDSVLASAEERRADLVGTGPEGSCDPRSLADALAILTDLSKRFFLAINPGSTESDFYDQDSTNKTHPPVRERINYLRNIPPPSARECKTLQP
jgi:Zn-dependent protease with chaperone function